MKKRIKILLLVVMVTSVTSHAIDGVYLGGRLGQFGLTGTNKTLHGSAIGYGIDLGIRSNAFMDAMIQYSSSSHRALNLSSLLFTAELGLGDASEFGFSLGIGPGFYFFDRIGVKNTYFGIHGSLAGDMYLSDALKAGMVFRWNGVFNPGDNYLSLMLRVGYLFEL